MINKRLAALQIQATRVIGVDMLESRLEKPRDENTAGRAVGKDRDVLEREDSIPSALCGRKHC